jgi:hypothetical protein
MQLQCVASDVCGEKLFGANYERVHPWHVSKVGMYGMDMQHGWFVSDVRIFSSQLVPIQLLLCSRSTLCRAVCSQYLI